MVQSESRQFATNTVTIVNLLNTFKGGELK